jgi:hypothetical protein
VRALCWGAVEEGGDGQCGQMCGSVLGCTLGEQQMCDLVHGPLRA